MSDGPTYCSVFPDATVDIIILGTPTGRARMAGDASAVPPDPPAEMIPAIPCWAAIQRANASVMPATAVPRSPVKTPDTPRGWNAATACGGTSAPEGRPEVERSTICTARPCSFRMSRIKRSSAPLVSRVPATSTVLPGRAVALSGWIGVSDARGRSVTVRAERSITATGTGWDQRVGGFGFET